MSGSTQRILLRSNLSGAAQVPPADAIAKEPFYSVGGFSVGTVATHFAGNELVVWDGNFFQPLVSGNRQVELVGNQDVGGRKTFSLGSISITGGNAGQVLSTDGGGLLSWTDAGGAGGPTYNWGLGLTLQPPDTVNLDVAGLDPGNIGGVFVTAPTSGIILAVTGGLSLAPASTTQIGGVIVPPNGGLVLAGLPPELAVDPASQLEAQIGTDSIKPITSSVLQLGPDPRGLVTTAKTLVGAINEIAGILGTVAGLLTIVGTYNAATDEVTPLTGSPFPPGQVLPPATAARVGFFLLVDTVGTPPPTSNAPQVPMVVNDMVVCVELVTNPGNYAWAHVPLGQVTVLASSVGITPIPPLTATNVQDALQQLNDGKLDAPLFIDNSLAGTGGPGDGNQLRVNIVDGGTFGF